jgi:hypothetical protein
MAIVNSIATYPGEGWQLSQVTGFAVSANALTVRVPASGSLSPTVARGLWRAKMYGASGTTPALLSLTVNALDGTNTCTIDAFVPVSAITISSTVYIDVCSDFILDTASASTGGSYGTLIFGGATYFNFVFTGSGTSYAWSADCEIFAGP